MVWGCVWLRSVDGWNDMLGRNFGTEGIHAGK